MKIGPYEVGATLGQGGVGIVYAARSPGGQDVAVKVLRKNEREVLARFERERRLLAALGEAEGFVPLLDAGTTEKGPYLVMPLLPGGTLRKKLEAGPLGIEETVALGRALAAALGRAHARGIVHRDMKPENVLFTGAGRPLVADLGLAKHFDPLQPGGSQSVSLSVHGAFRGTGGYMAPEQMSDSRSVGPTADVYALGVVLYECLAGEPPFVGQTLLDLIGKVTNGKFEPLRQRRPEAPGWLTTAVERALAPAEQDRFPDGAALERALATHPDAPRRRVAPVLIGAALLGSVAIGGVSLLVARGAAPAATEARITAVPVGELVSNAAAAAGRGDSVEARKILDRVRPYPALASASALDCGRRLYENRDWSRLAATSRLFLSLELSPEPKLLLEDWQLAAELELDPGRGLPKLKAQCQGRAGLERSPLAGAIQRFYEQALATDAPTPRLIELYPLPPGPDLRERVAAVCLADAKRLNEASIMSDMTGARLAGILDRIECARSADPRTPSLPDSVANTLFNTLLSLSMAVAAKQLPPNWETAFTGGPGRPGCREHPIQIFVRCRLQVEANDIPGALAEARRGRDAIGDQRTRLARRVAELFTADVFGDLHVSELRALFRSFAEVADSKLAWRKTAEACKACGDAAGEADARERAARAQDLTD